MRARLSQASPLQILLPISPLSTSALGQLTDTQDNSVSPEIHEFQEINKLGQLLFGRGAHRKLDNQTLLLAALLMPGHAGFNSLTYPGLL